MTRKIQARARYRITSIAMDPEQYALVRSLGRGISPVVREAIAEYLESRGMIPASPKTIGQIKEQITKEVVEQLRKELQDGIIQTSQRKRRSKNA